VLGVRPDGSDTATLRLEPTRPAHFAAGWYSLVRTRVDTSPKGVGQAYSVPSSPRPPSSEIEVTDRDVPGAPVSPVFTRQVGDGDQLHLHGPLGTLTWSEADGGPFVMIGAGSCVAPMASIMRFASARQSTVPMALLCSNRERTSVLLRELLEELDRHEDRVSVTHTFTRSPRAHRLAITAISMRR
jgi:ferredoxin-NADP reductase